MEFLDFTSLTLNEFQQLVPPFETAFQTRMAVWRMDGKPRTARRFTVYQNCPLPTPEDRLLFILVYIKTYTLQVVHGCVFGMVQGKANQWIHVLVPVLLAVLRTLGDAPARSLSALAQRLGIAEADAAIVVVPPEEESTPGAPIPAAAQASPLLPMTERRIVRPQAPPQQATCYSGKNKDHTVKNVLLVNALLVILFLSDTHGGRVHDLRIAETTPYPLPAGSGLLQDLGFLSFTLPEVEILMPTKKPRGAELTLEQHLTNQVLHQRRLWIEQVNSRVKRCRMVQDRIRLWKAGVRDLVMGLCCALPNFRVRLNPWLPMI
jgi:hypothetical protein